jgi:hypothetical protein
MSWVQLVENPETITSIFEQFPVLDQVRILEIQLLQDGPVVSLRINLNEFPTSPPPKWLAGQVNRVQIQLSLIGIRDIQIAGWCTDNIGNLDISRYDGGLLVVLDSAACKLRCEAEFIHVQKISAYCDSSR